MLERSPKPLKLPYFLQDRDEARTSRKKIVPLFFTRLQPRRYLPHLLHGNAGREPGERGRRRRRAGSKTVRCWVMNPQVRALMETKGNGPVLHQGKNAGGARKLRHV